jgi:crotonobetainyl-CoA:carnitine CoA-transferase CaiB-like acyl-CoA transferase
MPSRTGPLHGVRVLDLADQRGAYCGKLLAGMGADVIKIEPAEGCATRSIGPFHDKDGEDRERSLFFWHYNLNKRSVTLDLGDDDGRRHFLRLADSADVIVETFAPGHLDSLGLGCELLQGRNPRLTLVSLTPFGQSGPYRDRRSSDLTAQAGGGMLLLNGFPLQAPLQGFGLAAYHCASVYAAIGAVLALLARQRSGLGEHVDVSLHECVASYVEHATATFRQERTVAQRLGGLHWTRFFRIGRCRDGHLLHGPLGDWTSLLEWVKGDGKAGELAQAAWQDVGHRRRHCEQLFDRLDDWAQGYDAADLVEGAQLRRLPYAVVARLEDVAEDAQLAARRFFVDVDHPGDSAPVKFAGAPAVLSATPWQVYRRPPRLGEHNDEVFADTLRDPTQPQVAAPRRPPLQGLRVLDFTWVHAGPAATRVLADQGATVIKVERRDAMDVGDRRAGLTGNLNRGKRSVVIDLNHRRGIDLVRQLIRHSDVVVDNFSPRVMDNWGLGYEDLRALRPDIIAVRLSAFGGTGPDRDRVAYGPTLQARAGHTWMMRHAGSEPAGWGFSYSDLAAGCAAAFATLLAVWHRQRSGEGQVIDLSQFENLLSVSGPDLMQVLAGVTPTESGNGSREGVAVPHGVYPCADHDGAERWCAIAVFADEWARFVRALDAPPWARDERFATVAGRSARRAQLDALVASWTRTRPAEEVVDRLQRFGLCAAVAADTAALCDDAQLHARGYWQRVSTPEGKVVTVDGPPFRLSRSATTISAPGPLLGEHTDAVLRGVLGMDHGAIAALRRDGVIV